VNKFDSIRPYNDNEVNLVLSELINNRRFLKMLFETGEYKFIKNLPFSRKLLSLVLKNKIKGIHDIHSYQNVFENIVNDVINNSVNEFSSTGLENIVHGNGYLFISNHRDITLDSAFLNLLLHQHGFETTYNAVGNNLMSEKWASDLMRLNKSFIIDRSDKSKRQIYKSLNLASEFIFDSISINNKSIWIAQKQGRSKDGNDFTDPSVIKMIHLNARKKMPINEYLNSLNIIPISISYEKDPNDLLKARELYLTDLNKDYIKEPKEDLMSIAEGIRGNKGNVHINIGTVMNFEIDSYDDCSEKISRQINESYRLHPTNYAAAIIQGNDIPEHSYSDETIDDSILYLKERMQKITDDMQSYFLDQYSNPIKRK
tara:strand:- start:11874 stop:12989 length:1116 start_codon:yes stop_codon:yes gene_type:complete